MFELSDEFIKLLLFSLVVEFDWLLDVSELMWRLLDFLVELLLLLLSFERRLMIE